MGPHIQFVGRPRGLFLRLEALMQAELGASGLAAIGHSLKEMFGGSLEEAVSKRSGGNIVEKQISNYKLQIRLLISNFRCAIINMPYLRGI